MKKLRLTLIKYFRNFLSDVNISLKRLLCYKLFIEFGDLFCEIAARESFPTINKALSTFGNAHRSLEKHTTKSIVYFIALLFCFEICILKIILFRINYFNS